MAAMFLCLVGWGCAVSTHMTITQRSGLEQRLLVRSLERAVAQLDIQRFSERQVTLDLFTLTDGDTRTFAEEFVIAQLKERGLGIVPDGEPSALKLHIFASVLGVDQSERLVGLPTFLVPVVGTPVPELAVSKSERNQGRTELQVYAFDGQTGSFVGKSSVGLGRANYDRYKVRVLINFTVSDLEAGDATP